MKKIFLHLFTLLVIGFCLTSCLKDNEEATTVSNDTAVLSFVITSGNVVKTTRDKQGRDSVYTQVMNLSRYRFSVDQLSGTIYNTEPLPYGTNVAKLLTTVNTKNGGVVFAKYGKLQDFALLTPTDSVDYSQPIDLRVYSPDGTYYRAYKVTVNVNSLPETSLLWGEKLANVSTLARLQRTRLLQLNEKLYLLGDDGTNMHLYETNINDGKTWTLLTANVAFDASATPNATVCNNTFFIWNKQKLYKSVDGSNWTEVNKQGIVQLLGTDNTTLYALNAQKQLVASTDMGETWNIEPLGGASQYLPTQQTSVVTSGDTPMLLGTYTTEDANQGDAFGVWRRMTTVTEDNNRSQWNFYGTTHARNLNSLLLNNTHVASYGTWLVTMAKNNDTTTQPAQPFAFYVSKDNGLNWRKSTDWLLPDTFDARANGVAFAIDSHNNVWLVGGNTGEVWKANGSVLTTN